jgi:hypothetical protein
MSAHPAYHSSVDHEPTFLAYGLPADGVLTADRLHEFPDDPYWTYELAEPAPVRFDPTTLLDE